MKQNGYGKYIFAFLIFCAITLGFMLPAGVRAESDAACIEIKYGQKTIVYRDEKILPSDFTVAEQIEERRINAPLGVKTEFAESLLAKGASYSTALDVCFPLLKNTVKRVADELYIEPESAQVCYVNGNFTVKKEVVGRALDENKLYAAIFCALKYSGGGSVTAHTVELKPEQTSAELKANFILRGEYTTNYAGSTPSRSHNIELALSRLDGMALIAGERLSFNAAVGERTEQNGYESAKIIVDGKYTEGVGGGVCQASTAVYNAALIAGLDCAANAHSICPSYCPAGLDAMISSVSDLVVVNNTAHTVYISARAAKGRARVRFYGEPSEYIIKPTSEVVSVTRFEHIEKTDSDHTYFDKGTPSGDRLLVSSGHDGCASVTYLVYFTRSGEEVRRVRIRANEYKTVPEVIAIAP